MCKPRETTCHTTVTTKIQIRTLILRTLGIIRISEALCIIRMEEERKSHQIDLDFQDYEIHQDEGNPENPPNPENPGLTALVLAGRRGPKDSLAHAAGQSHKACIAVAGVPMIGRVLTSLRAAKLVQNITVSIDEAAVLADCAEAGGISAHASLSSPAASVLDYFEAHGAQGPVLVTTADHALLIPAMVEHFCAAAQHSDADIVIGVVSASLFRASYPESRRTFLPLADGSWSGTNLFLLRTPRAARAVRFWVRAGQFRKRPWRLVSTFGLGNLLRFLFRRLDRSTALVQASRVLGVRVGLVEMPFAEAALDVDTPDDLVTVERILATRAAGVRTDGSIRQENRV